MQELQFVKTQKNESVVCCSTSKNFIVFITQYEACLVPIDTEGRYTKIEQCNKLNLPLNETDQYRTCIINQLTETQIDIILGSEQELNLNNLPIIKNLLSHQIVDEVLQEQECDTLIKQDHFIKKYSRIRSIAFLQDHILISIYQPKLRIYNIQQEKLKCVGKIGDIIIKNVNFPDTIVFPTDDEKKQLETKLRQIEQYYGSPFITACKSTIFAGQSLRGSLAFIYKLNLDFSIQSTFSINTDKGIRAIDFLEAKELAVLGSYSGTIYQINFKGEILYRIDEHENTVHFVKFFQENGIDYLLSGSQDSTAILWKQQNNKLQFAKKFIQIPDWVKCTHYSKAAMISVISNKKYFIQFKNPLKEKLKCFKCHSYNILWELTWEFLGLCLYFLDIILDVQSLIEYYSIQEFFFFSLSLSIVILRTMYDIYEDIQKEKHMKKKIILMILNFLQIRIPAEFIYSFIHPHYREDFEFTKRYKELQKIRFNFQEQLQEIIALYLLIKDDNNYSSAIFLKFLTSLFSIFQGSYQQISFDESSLMYSWNWKLVFMFYKIMEHSSRVLLLVLFAVELDQWVYLLIAFLIILGIIINSPTTNFKKFPYFLNNWISYSTCEQSESSSLNGQFIQTYQNKLFMGIFNVEKYCAKAQRHVIVLHATKIHVMVNFIFGQSLNFIILFALNKYVDIKNSTFDLFSIVVYILVSSQLLFLFIIMGSRQTIQTNYQLIQ